MNAARSKCDVFDPLPNNAHRRGCENEAAPHDVDIYFPLGNPEPKFHNIRWQVFYAAWQVLYVLDIELSHGLGSAMAQCHFPIDHPRKRICGQPRDPECGMRLGFDDCCPHASLFHQAVFVKFLIFVSLDGGLRINLDVLALVHSEIFG